MRPVLSVHSPSLHDALKSLSLAVAPRVDELSLQKPVGGDLFADGQQPLVVCDAEFLQMPFRRHPLNRVVAQHRFRNILLVPVSVADTDGVVAMFLSGLVADDLYPIELQDRTRYPYTAIGVKDGRHALLDS